MANLAALLLAPLLASAAPSPAGDVLDIFFFRGPGRCDALAYQERSVDAPVMLCVYQGERTVCLEYRRDRTLLDGQPCRAADTGALVCGAGEAVVETDFDPGGRMLSYLTYRPGRRPGVIFPEPVACRGLRFERRNRTGAGLPGA